MDNVYYDPDKFGLTVVAEIDYSSGSYEFDTRVVWMDAGGKKYTARDSGCSCPTPFEDYPNIESLSAFDYDEIKREADAELAEEYGVYVTAAEVQEFLEKVRA